jgi:hypothetical protein
MYTLPPVLSRAAIMLTVCVLSGCVPLAPDIDHRFGHSLNLLKAQQTIDINASRNTQMVTMDGVSAGAAVELYNKSYRAPTPQPNVFTIGVGGASN